MRRRLILIIGVILICSVIGVSSFDFDSSYELVAGKNVVEFSGINSFYVENLVELNPEIEVVSFADGGNTIGFVNVFGGIGDNFPVRDGVYEIIVRKDISLNLPNNE